MIRFSVFLLFSIFLFTTSYSQSIVTFDKRGKVKRVRYFEGEYISLKLVSKQKVSGVIQSIQNDLFVVEGVKVNLDSVQKVYRSQTGSGFRLGATVFAIPAIGYLPLVTFNRLINQDSPVIREKTISVTAGFIGTAILFGYFGNRPYRISEKRPLKIIDISI